MYSGRMVVLGLKWLCSGKSCFNRVKWLSSDKVVVFGQNGCNRQSGCIRKKCFYLAKVVVFGQKWL